MSISTVAHDPSGASRHLPNFVGEEWNALRLVKLAAVAHRC
jgi:hypothetical protein